MICKIYHAVGTVPKYTTLSEQFQNIPRCRNSYKIYHAVGTTAGYILELFRQRGIFCNCSDSVVYFGTVPTAWLSRCRNSSKIYHAVGTVTKYTTLSEQFQNIPRCRNSYKIYPAVVYFGTVPTAWYILELFRQRGIF
jgi:hypothetical protein